MTATPIDSVHLKTLVVITGPTGIGKTALAIDVAQTLGSPIINADSRQIYRDIPIGTAAPTAEEQELVRHYFVGMLRLEDYYSAAQYETEALALLEDLFKSHDVLVMSGGSMLYIDAVCNGIDDIPAVSGSVRAMMQERLASEGLPALAEELRLLDPEYYASCDLKNPKRVVHALEICHTTGLPFTAYRSGVKKVRPFRVLRIGLERERYDLFERISTRVDSMMAAGLLEEARRVLPFRDCNALNTVGYKELFNYFDGVWSLDMAVDKIKRNSRVYAKKQMTWFKKDASTYWFHPNAAIQIRNFILRDAGRGV